MALGRNIGMVNGLQARRVMARATPRFGHRAVRSAAFLGTGVAMYAGATALPLLVSQGLFYAMVGAAVGTALVIAGLRATWESEE